MDDESDRETSRINWKTVCGDIPKEEIIYFCQIFIVLIVILACLVNLSISKDNTALWSSLLSGSVGYVLPAPRMRKKHDTFLPDSPQQ